MTSKAHVESDPIRQGVRVAIVRERGNGPLREVLQWDLAQTIRADDPTVAAVNEADWLRLDQDDARALYEALGDHFGHAGHDIRALRKDYDAERGRVDKLLAHLTGSR